MLEESKESEDPHVERLLEAFAFLAGRVHLKLDDDFPRSRGLPRHRLPAFHPARSFHVDRRVPSRPGTRKLTTGLKIDRGTVLYSRPVGGVPCKFRTCYDTTVWPVSVTSAEWTTPASCGRLCARSTRLTRSGWW